MQALVNFHPPSLLLSVELETVRMAELALCQAISADVLSIMCGTAVPSTLVSVLATTKREYRGDIEGNAQASPWDM